MTESVFLQSMSWLYLLLALLVVFSVPVLYTYLLRFKNASKRASLLRQMDRSRIVGFFHPHWWVYLSPFNSHPLILIRYISNAGGGGERVLWTAIAYLQRTEPQLAMVVYTGDIDVSRERIVENVKVLCVVFA